MDQLHEQADEAIDKLLTEIDHFERVVGQESINRDRVDLALAQAKRVRRDSNMVVRALARLRDHATAQEGTST